MELAQFFKSIIDQDENAIVICDLNHKIIYMNPASRGNYSKHGGDSLVGRNLMDCHNEKSQEMICKVVEWFKVSKEHNRIYIYHDEKQNKDVYMIALRDEQGDLIGYYEKHEYRNRETERFYNFD